MGQGCQMCISTLDAQCLGPVHGWLLRHRRCCALWMERCTTHCAPYRRNRAHRASRAHADNVCSRWSRANNINLVVYMDQVCSLFGRSSRGARCSTWLASSEKLCGTGSAWLLNSPAFAKCIDNCKFVYLRINGVRLFFFQTGMADNSQCQTWQPNQKTRHVRYGDDC